GRLIPFDGRLNDAAFLSTPEGLRVVAASAAGRVKTWVLADGRPVGKRDVPLTGRPPYPRRYVAFMHGGRWIAGIDKANATAVGVWDAGTGDRVTTLSAGRGPVQVLAVDGTGRLVTWATGTGRGEVAVHWRDPAVDSQPPAPLSFPTPGLMALAIDPA